MESSKSTNSLERDPSPDERILVALMREQVDGVAMNIAVAPLPVLMEELTDQGLGSIAPSVNHLLLPRSFSALVLGDRHSNKDHKEPDDAYGRVSQELVNPDNLLFHIGQSIGPFAGAQG